MPQPNERQLRLIVHNAIEDHERLRAAVRAANHPTYGQPRPLLPPQPPRRRNPWTTGRLLVLYGFVAGLAVGAILHFVLR